MAGEGTVIRRFAEGDAEAVSALIAATLRTSNRRDYTEAYLEDLILRMRPEDILRRAREQHFYVAEEAGAIVGCGSVGAFRGREDESCLFTIFVRPEAQGRGLGRGIVERLERDPYFLRARRIEVPASLTAVPFYLKLGYVYVNGAEPDAERLIRMEKRRCPDAPPV
ncbi:MAG: GNAT family N-acetyltransferase [Clostridia bacterium]|nr:GNAT family N-acetyltransferase [Clostridia bacterium]